MPLHPVLENLLARVPAPVFLSDPLEHRAMEQPTVNALAAQLAEPYPEQVDRRLVTIPVDDGEIELLIYLPASQGPHPGYVFFFGGGFRGGSIHYDYIDGMCRERCVGADAVVISVGYRLAPERKFPSAVGDGYAALTWVAEHADELGIRPDALIIGGQSSGGNIAATTSLWSRDHGGPAIALQILEVAALDPTSETNLSEYGKGYILEDAEFEQIIEDLFASPEDARNPYASPVLAEDVSRLPPALILTAEFDLTRGSAEAYARRLENAGVPVRYVLSEGQIHASPMMTKVLRSAREWQDTVIAAIRNVSLTPPAAN